MRNQIKYFAILFSALMLFSCKDQASYSKISNAQVKNASNVHKIVVNEFLDGGSYAYINVSEGSDNYWMAIGKMPVNVGETYYYEGGIIMKDFESKQLKKTFDFITFVDGIRKTEVAVSKKGSTSVKEDVVKDELIKIETPANGISLGKLFSTKESLVKKPVIVRGKVIKVNNGIMDKNWVHISDGTQFESKKSLTVTTLENVKVGDIVTFKGILILDKDFGQGYVYDILLEEGELIQ